MDDYKDEDYHPNPAVRRAKAGLRKSLGGKVNEAPEHDGHGPVVETSVVKHKDGKAHVRARHEDGHEAIHEHPHEQAAHEHAKALMSPGEEHPENPELDTRAEEEEGNAAAGSEPGAHDPEGSAEGEENESCPNCGSEMSGGKCPVCGYSENEGEEHEEED